MYLLGDHEFEWMKNDFMFKVNSFSGNKNKLKYKILVNHFINNLVTFCNTT